MVVCKICNVIVMCKCCNSHLASANDGTFNYADLVKTQLFTYDFR